MIRITCPPLYFFSAALSRSLLMLFATVAIGISSAAAQSSIMRYDDFTKTNSPEVSRAASLYNDEQDAVYAEIAQVKIYGSRPVCLYTDPSSIKTLSQHHFPADHIEMIIIRITSKNDLRHKIDFSQLAMFPKLKYIFISALIDVNKTDVEKIAGSSNNYIILYHTAKPS